MVALSRAAGRLLQPVVWAAQQVDAAHENQMG
jgi:hypothetical protein